MTTLSLLPFVLCPDADPHHFIMNKSVDVMASRFMPRTLPPAREESVVRHNCNFCDETFVQQDALDSHILTQHPTHYVEPGVLPVDTEFRIRPLPTDTWTSEEKQEVEQQEEDEHRCILCRTVLQNAAELDSHMRKHKDYYGHRYEAVAKAQQQQQQHPDSLATINGVVQDPQHPSILSSLEKHSQVHNHERVPDTKKAFLQALGLRPKDPTQVLPVRTSTWVPQLTYQAWKLATKDHASKSKGNKREKKQRGRKRHAQPPSVAPPPPVKRRRSLVQERPTTCEYCQKVFRTYHQLVLHSRMHKKEKNGAKAPPPSLHAKQSRTISEQKEGSDDAMVTGEDHSKRCKECSYCGKSLKSSYYLTIHLRTHTGEKPFKCVHCNYAAARKTSLKYHVERRHKDVASLQRPSGPSGPSGPPSLTEDQHMNKVPASNRTERKRKLPLSQSHTLIKTARKGFSPAPPLSDGAIQPKQEDVKIEDVEEPLNLSLRGSSRKESVVPPVPKVCELCPFESVHPEALITHKQLLHRIPSNRRSDVELIRKRKHSTGCPPALHGNDVAPMRNVRHPRKTKSATPQPAKPQETAPVAPSRQTPEGVEPQPTNEASRHREAAIKTSTGNQYMTDRMGMVPLGAPMLHCTPTQLRPLPEGGDFEPSTKKMRLHLPSEPPGFRPAPADAANSLARTAQCVKTPVQGPGLGTAAEALLCHSGPISSAPDGGLHPQIPREKPYKCVHCNYAAARKTSLKCHVERQHEDVASLQRPSEPSGPSGSPSLTEDQHMNKVPASNRTERKRKLPLNQSHTLIKTARKGFSPAPPLSDGAIQPKQEDVKIEDVEEPINLSLRGSSRKEAVVPPVPKVCELCPFESVHPEALITHKQLLHKIPSNRRSDVELIRKHSTGCHPRKTKSAHPQPVKPQETTPVAPPRQTPERVEPQPTHEASRHQEAAIKTSTGNQYMMDRMGMVPLGAPMWHCTPTQLRPLPQGGVFEPSTKKMRLHVPSEPHAFRPAPAD